MDAQAIRPQKSKDIFSKDSKFIEIIFNFNSTDKAFEALKQKLATVMPASGTDNDDAASISSSTTSIQRSAPATTVVSSAAPTTVSAVNQDSITSMSNIENRPSHLFAHSTSVDASLEAPKRKDEA